MKNKVRSVSRINACFNRIALILSQAKNNVVHTINTEMVRAYWLIGKEIVEEEQGGQKRAPYGEFLLSALSKRMIEKFGKGYSVTLLKRMRQFYLAYPKGAAVRHQLGEAGSLSWTHYRHLITIEDESKRSFMKLRQLIIVGPRENWKDKHRVCYMNG